MEIDILNSNFNSKTKEEEIHKIFEVGCQVLPPVEGTHSILKVDPQIENGNTYLTAYIIARVLGRMQH